MRPVWRLVPRLSSGQDGSARSVKCARLADNREKTPKCWFAMPVIRATTPSVSSQPWILFPLTHGNAEGVVYVRSVVSVDLACQVQPSGLTTTPYVRAASVTAAPCVVFAAKLPTHLSLCSAAACATGGCTVSVLYQGSFQKPSAFAGFARRISSSLSLNNISRRRYKQGKRLKRLKETWI